MLHLDDPHCAFLVRNIEAIRLLSPVVISDYLVPAITINLDQISPQRTRPPSETRAHFNAHVQSMAESYGSQSYGTLSSEETCAYVDETGESPYVRSFRDNRRQTQIQSWRYQ